MSTTLTAHPGQPAPGVRTTSTRGRTSGSPLLGYAIQNLLLTLRKSAYVTFVIGMPLVMYLLFNQIYGKQISENGLTVGSWIMVSMAVYGALGAAQNSGATLQMERRSGWFRQLSVAGLRGRDFIVGKLACAMVLMVPSIAIVFAAGALTGVHLTARQWIESGALAWASTLPMILLGLVIALWFSTEAAQPANTILMMVLAILGGLWFPADSFPHVMQVIARATPTYWIRTFAQWPLDAGAFPVRGVLVLLIWAAALAALAAAGFRRATRTSKR